MSLITYFNPSSGGEGGMNLAFSNLNIGRVLYVFIAGMIAISAMVLPGISGSTLLLIFGLYAPIMNAIKSFLKFDFSYTVILIVFALGIIAGICSTIKIIRYSLEKYRSKVIFLVLGLMIGSLYAIFMGPTTLEVPQNAMTFKSFNIIFFIIGGALIIGLEKLKAVISK
ncbi:MAG: undecaprenyl phosphate translocase family protein [Clostridium sp.]